MIKENSYKKYYKYFFILPIILIIFSIFSISNTIKEEGNPIYRDIELKGGLTATIEKENHNFDIDELKLFLENENKENSFQISNLKQNGINTGIFLKTDLDEEILIEQLEKKLKINIELGENYSSSFISETLSNNFFTQAIYVLIFSFVFMSFVVFFYFREFVPSLAIILSVTFDLFVTIGILNLFKFEFTIGAIGALIMLIGYSVDTDILLTNRLLNEKGDNFEKLFEAFKTGILMSLTTAFACLLAIFLTNSQTIENICIVIFVGLIVDMISTWMQNSGILFWWIEKKSK